MKNNLYLKLNFGMKFVVRNNNFTIIGPLGTFSFVSSKIFEKNNRLTVRHICTLLKHIFIGFWRGFLVCLFIDGVGYRVQLQNEILCFNIGFVDMKQIQVPNKINIFIDSKETSLFIFSSNFSNLMQFTTKILNLKKINVYKGKGISKIGVVFKPKQILKK